MTQRRRQHAVFACLAAVALWPLVQHALARQYHLNPWKLGGFAMYTVPVPPVAVHVLEVEGNELSLLDPTAWSAAARSRYVEFQRRRHAIGQWALPRALVSQLERERPAGDGFVIVIQRFELDSETARFHVHEDRYIFPRNAPP
ncbi:MAG: hypothetical protein MJE66_00920 [Proteobacteria bacterium]|nr:hypothetical protein [Pseudomonadota bacterium]